LSEKCPLLTHFDQISGVAYTGELISKLNDSMKFGKKSKTSRESQLGPEEAVRWKKPEVENPVTLSL